ncbi:MAG: DUF2138 domain-containing protein, partial [Methylocella sp.]
WKTESPRDLAEHSELQLNLSEPDALIESRSLSKLPRDLLEIPVLRDTLTEDFVFYYESNPDRLGIAGSLRRIIYEHDLQLQDELINQLLDEPATVALWRGGTGKLAHVMLLIERNGLSRLLETLAKVALDDSRLTVAGELHVDGDELRLFRLQYAPERSVLFASHDDQLVVLSDARMLLENTSKSAKLAKDAVAGLESVLEGDTSLAEHFGLDESAAEHRITLSADYISMGYRAFFPALAGFTLEKDKTGWHSQLAFDPVDDARKLDFTAIWRSMPMGASACAAVPISSELPGKLAQRLGASKDQQKVIEAHLKGPAGVCWYASSRLYTPLIITRSSSDRIEELDAVSGNLFEQMIGGIERNFGRRFPVQSTNLANGKRWQRMVGSDFGQYPAEQAMDPSVLKSTGFFSVSLARQADMLIFSLDDKLVDQALATLAKSYPPLLDQLPKDRIVPFYLAPQALAPLIRAEALESLPDDLEAVFRNAAETHLFPKLEKFKAFGKFAVTLPAGTEPDDEWEWIAITWQPL